MKILKIRLQVTELKTKELPSRDPSFQIGNKLKPLQTTNRYNLVGILSWNPMMDPPTIETEEKTFKN